MGVSIFRYSRSFHIRPMKEGAWAAIEEDGRANSYTGGRADSAPTIPSTYKLGPRGA